MKAIFKKEPENKKIYVTREFAGALELVWRAWTTPELLDQWWAPKPYKAVTIRHEFKEGGQWFYYMESPEGERHYCLADYKKIVPQKSYDGIDAFCDDKGNINKDFPRMDWHVVFSPSTTGTKVDVEITYESAEAMQKVLEMGFEEGFSMAFGNLDEMLAKK